ncbi:MAG: hypothetical protein ACOCRY_01415 [Alkalispirochaetaceae bacterium]
MQEYPDLTNDVKGLSAYSVGHQLSSAIFAALLATVMLLAPALSAQEREVGVVTRVVDGDTAGGGTRLVVRGARSRGGSAG